MDKNLLLSDFHGQRAASLRRHPAMSLQQIVGAGACEACRGRITKVKPLPIMRELNPLTHRCI